MSTATAVDDPTARPRPPRPRRPAGPARTRAAGAVRSLLVVLTVVFVGPLLWMLLTSFKTHDGATGDAAVLAAAPGTADGYRPLLDTDAATPVLRWFVNSLLAGVGERGACVATAALAAYALARLGFRGQARSSSRLIVGTLFVPPFVFLIPNYLIVSKLGWLDTLLGGDRARRRRRVRRVLPAAVLPRRCRWSWRRRR